MYILNAPFNIILCIIFVFDENLIERELAF